MPAYTTEQDLAAYRSRLKNGRRGGKETIYATQTPKGRQKSTGKAKSGKIPHRKVLYDGYVFDSVAESERYKELRLLEQAGHLRHLKVHPKFALIVKGKKIGTYTADFEYEELHATDYVFYVLEDVKSEHTRKLREYQRNRKLMEACYGVTIREVVK